ncbi:polysaccharide deacetylase family protein [Herbidospora sp. RD11066]
MRAAVAVGLIVLAGCVACGANQEQKAATTVEVKPAAIKPVSAANAKAVKANELGQIPVLMYHRIIENPATQDDRTPKQFRTELDRLAKEGYVPVTAAEYVTGKIDIPAGKHPVVLTFDDSSPSQVTLDGSGTPAKDTAAAILLEAGAKHPGFRPVGTFYVTRDMFGKSSKAEQAQIIAWMKQRGFELGNHTKDHTNLMGKSKQIVLDEVTAGHKLITDLNGGPVVTLALPYGNQPKTKEWALKGSEKGVNYSYSGVFLAGYMPAQSPFSSAFDPLGIPRIRSMDKKGDCTKFCSTGWLDWLKDNPGERYTSDGDPRTVAFPKFQETMLAPGAKTKALAY